MPLTIEGGGFPFTSMVTRMQAAYIDTNGYAWDASSLANIGNGGSAGTWWGNTVVHDTTSGGNVISTQYGQPIYQDNGLPYPNNAGCHLAFYVVPVEPRLTFAYYDGSSWRFATIKDTGVTGDSGQVGGSTWHPDPGCTNPWNGVGSSSDRAFVSTTNSGVAWNLTAPSASFNLPLHQEYR
jgi:hypothetical protein